MAQKMLYYRCEICYTKADQQPEGGDTLETQATVDSRCGNGRRYSCDSGVVLDYPDRPVQCGSGFFSRPVLRRFCCGKNHGTNGGNDCIRDGHRSDDNRAVGRYDKAHHGESQSADPGSYIQPAGAPWNLLLVNAWNPMDKAYYQDTYKNHIVKYKTGGQIDDRVAVALEKMLEAAKETGLKAGYLFRTPEKSASNLENKTQYYMKKGYSRDEARKKALGDHRRPLYERAQSGTRN